jgi:HD-GYP domain-containing protein (c-di-GMP phosphodiesterase class II)
MQGEEIPLGSRIIRVCDVFVALISDRAYRKAFDPETALLMVIDEVRHFDMKIFLAFQRIINTTDVLSEIEMILSETENL